MNISSNSIIPITYYLNDKDKEILLNFFILRKNNSKQVFKLWIEDFFSHYSIESKDPSKSIYNSDYQIDMIWDKTTNTNLKQYLFSHPQFKPSNNNLTNIYKFKSNESHTDINGNSFLHIVGYKQQYHKLINYSKEIDSIINHEGLSHHMLFSSLDTQNIIEKTPLGFRNYGFDSQENVLFNFFENIYHKFIAFQENHIYDLVSSEKNLHYLSELKNFSDFHCLKIKDFFQHNVNQAFFKEQLQLSDRFRQNIDSLTMSLELQSQLEEKQPKKTHKI